MTKKLDTAKLDLNLGTIDVEIVGVATTAQPIMGRMLILRAPAVRSDFYPYDYIVCAENMLEEG